MKRALVTGSSDGIGRATAIELARRGVHVIVHGRTSEKARLAAEEVSRSSGSSEVEWVSGDLSSLAEVRKLAEQVVRLAPRLEILINNAGVTTRERRLSQEGYELTFAVNHLAPFLLTNLLLDLLRASAPARIINVASMTHAGAHIDFGDLQSERSFDGYEAYSRSKLANLLFTRELARRLAGSGVTANALHPGVIDTKLLRVNFSGGSPVEMGARTPVYLSLSSEVEGVSGEYFAGERRSRSSAESRDPKIAERLWEASARLVALGGEGARRGIERSG